MPRRVTGGRARTKAQAELGIASGFVDPVVINLFLGGRRKSGAPLGPKRTENLFEAAECAASGTSAFRRKSLCHHDFQERPVPYFTDRAAVRLRLSV
jgi:hypothetical protein